MADDLVKALAVIAAAKKYILRPQCARVLDAVAQFGAYEQTLPAMTACIEAAVVREVGADTRIP